MSKSLFDLERILSTAQSCRLGLQRSFCPAEQHMHDRKSENVEKILVEKLKNNKRGYKRSLSKSTSTVVIHFAVRMTDMAWAEVYWGALFLKRQMGRIMFNGYRRGYPCSGVKIYSWPAAPWLSGQLYWEKIAVAEERKGAQTGCSKAGCVSDYYASTSSSGSGH